VLYSNRSLCLLKCDEAYDALLDACACIGLKPEWHKGYYRKGAALMSLLVKTAKQYTGLSLLHTSTLCRSLIYVFILRSTKKHLMHSWLG
jgi:hypothetical protein